MKYVVRGFKPHGWELAHLQRADDEQEARRIAQRESATKQQRDRVYAVDRYDPVKDEWKRVVAYVNGAVTSDRRAMVGI